MLTWLKEKEKKEATRPEKLKTKIPLCNCCGEIDFPYYSDPTSLPCSCHSAPWWTSSPLQALFLVLTALEGGKTILTDPEGLPYAGGREKGNLSLWTSFWPLRLESQGVLL